VAALAPAPIRTSGGPASSGLLLIEMPTVIGRQSEFAALVAYLNQLGAMEKAHAANAAALAENTGVGQQVALGRLYGPIVKDR
jgi:hypothetical protein